MDLKLSGTGSGPPSRGWDGAGDMGPSRSQGMAKVPSTPVLGTFTGGTLSAEANEDFIPQEPQPDSHGQATTKLHSWRGAGEQERQAVFFQSSKALLPAPPSPGFPHRVTNSSQLARDFLSFKTQSPTSWEPPWSQAS